jgi:biotin carboxylase
VQEIEQLKGHAEKVGYPVMIKAVMGARYCN